MAAANAPFSIRVLDLDAVDEHAMKCSNASLKRRSLRAGQFAIGVIDGGDGQGRVQFTEGVPQPALHNNLSIVVAFRCRRVRRNLRPIRHMPPKLPQPLKGGLFNISFMEGGHGEPSLNSNPSRWKKSAVFG